MLHFCHVVLECNSLLYPNLYGEAATSLVLYWCIVIITLKEKEAVMTFGFKMQKERVKLLKEVWHIEEIENPEKIKIGERPPDSMTFEIEVGKNIWFPILPKSGDWAFLSVFLSSFLSSFILPFTFVFSFFLSPSFLPPFLFLPFFLLPSFFPNIKKKGDLRRLEDLGHWGIDTWISFTYTH